MKVISKDHHVYSFHPNMVAVATAESGDLIQFETYDSYRGQIKGHTIDSNFKLDGINPATGPLLVNGAESGDTLKVTIIKIELEEEGLMYLRPGVGALKKFVTNHEVKRLKVENHKIIYDEFHSFALKPMIGVIGVSSEEEVSTSSPGRHGGNMDTKEITEGSILYFPVFNKGVMLALGDIHAIMGDGEVPICGVEIGGRVTIKVEVIKKNLSNWPIVEDNKNYHLVASANTLDDASQIAIESMFLFLNEHCSKFSSNDLIRLMGIIGNLGISQVVNPLKTAKFVIPKEIFEIELG